jgi:DNA-binding NarL/FixJ family response regulator
MAGKVLLISDDVMFWANVHALAKGAGVPAARVADEASMEAAVREGNLAKVFADLGSRSVDLLGWARRLKALDPPPRLIAYGSHVDAEGMERAAAAGFDEVMPNSRFHRTLPELLRQ